MTRTRFPNLIILGLVWTITGTPSAHGQPASAPAAPSLDSREVQGAILPGTPPPPPPVPAPVQVMPTGDISLNFPGVEVQAVAKAVLGDTLGLPFSVDPAAQGRVSVVTPYPIRKADVLGFFEQALTSANLVLADRAGIYTILPATSARSEAPVVGPDDPGYGNETVVLKFVNAEQMRKLLDPLVPNAVSVSDPTLNALILSGDATQRRALRDLVAQFDVDWLKGMSFALFVPQRTDARLIAPELEKLLNAPGSPTAGLVQLIAMNQLNGILAISSQPQYLEDVRRFMEVLDREGEGAEKAIFVYHVQNGRAADLTKVLNSAFGGADSSSSSEGSNAPELDDRTESNAAQPLAQAAPMGQGAEQTSKPRNAQDAASSPSSDATAATITADDTNNAIVVFATPRTYALIEDALAKLDVPPLQVMIDASISEVTLNHALQYGIEWTFQSGNSSGGLTSGNTLPPAPVQNVPGFTYLYQGANFQATLNALKTITDVNVLSAPKLMVLNNHTATIEVGDQVPIITQQVQSTLTSGTASPPIVNSVDYRDTGVILKVTPRVNSGGLVLLDIAQEVSDVLAQTTAQISAGQSPTIEQRKIATSVAVQDGQTLALGGLIKNEVTKGRTTIPVLGDIPVLGHLFGDTSNTLTRTELVVFLTPHVVRTPVDAAAVTEELREKIHLAEPPPPAHKRARHAP